MDWLTDVVQFLTGSTIETIVGALLTIVGGAKAIVALWPNSWLAGPLKAIYRALEFVSLNLLDNKTNQLGQRTKPPLS